MLFFHKFEDIRAFPMAFRYSDVDLRAPPFGVIGFPQISTLDEISEDLWDYHLDHKRWWQQEHNVSPLPSVPPHYGKVFPKPKIKITKIVFRQIVTGYEASGIISPFTLNYARPDAGVPFHLNPPRVFGVIQLPVGTIYYEDNQGPGASHLLCQLTPFPTQGIVPSTPTTFPVYWASSWGVVTGSPSDTATTHLGVFSAHKNIFNMAVSPGFTQTVLRDETISDFKVARLNYLTPVDAKVLRKGDSGGGPAFDPQPTTEPLWRGVWNSGTDYVLSDIVSKISVSDSTSHTYFCIRPGIDRDPETSPTWWERCNRPKTQIVAGSILNLTGDGSELAYLFPGRNDIMMICRRIYPSATPFNQHDWRGQPNTTLGNPFGDIFGFGVYPPEAVGFNHIPGITLPSNTPFDFTDGAPVNRDNGLTNIPKEPLHSEATLDTDGESYNFYESQQDYFIEEFISCGLTFV